MRALTGGERVTLTRGSATGDNLATLVTLSCLEGKMRTSARAAASRRPRLPAPQLQPDGDFAQNVCCESIPVHRRADARQFRWNYFALRLPGMLPPCVCPAREAFPRWQAVTGAIAPPRAGLQNATTHMPTPDVGGRWPTAIVPRHRRCREAFATTRRPRRRR